MNKFKTKILQHLLVPITNSKGVAMMMALFVMMILTFLATETAFRTNIESNIAVQGISRLKAYYAAKAGLELSLFRIMLYKKALASFGEHLGSNKSMLDPIWQFPLMWPPVLTEEISGIDKSQIQEAVAESKMESTYSATIESEGSKIDINDLGSSSKALVKATRDQILQIFQTEFKNNEKFNKDYGTFNFEELINNMIDWVDEGDDSLNGGSERNYYQDIRNDAIPPNAPFKTLKELHMVANMTDEIYQVLAKQITVYGSKGVNVNYSDKAVLRSLDVQMTDEIVDKIISHRTSPTEGGHFSNLDDFLNYLESLGVRSSSFNPAGIPLSFDAELNFRIHSVGQYGRVSREIEVVTYDFENVKERYIEILTKDQEDKNSADIDNSSKDNSPSDQNNSQPNKRKLNPTKGRPTVVYWHEN